MLPTLEDERREREKNEEGDPEELLHQEPPPAPEEETVIDQNPEPEPEAGLVLDEGVPPDAAVVVDMDPDRRNGVDIVDISKPPAEANSRRRRPRGGNGQALSGRSHRGEGGSLEPGGDGAAEGSSLDEGPAARLARRRETRDLSRKRKLAYLLAQEVRRIVEELALRHDLLLQVWSRMRSRQPLLDLLRTRYEELRPDDLLLLSVDCLEHLERFYRVLDEFRLYLLVTEDMPTTLETTYEHFRITLSQIARPLLLHLDDTHRHVDPAVATAPRAGALLE